MSSQKYLQKRVGYLAAVQSFRPDTDVLMLATNLLKKVPRLLSLQASAAFAHETIGCFVFGPTYNLTSLDYFAPYHYPFTGSLAPL